MEGHHRGAVVHVDAAGDIIWSRGDPETVIFPRSCNKPIQTVGLLRAGLRLRGRLLALSTASHSGEPMHLDGVREILALAELDESALQTPASYPLDPHVHADYIRSGGVRAPIAMDCSGKHAAMLSVCVDNGWDTTAYLRLEHPVQQAIVSAFEELTGGPAGAIGVDGCGAPLLGTSLVRLARSASTLIQSSAGTVERELVDAMVGWPEYVSGASRDECHLVKAFPGAIAKSGAEGVYVVAMPDGHAFALKIDDGSERAREPAMARALTIAGYAHEILERRHPVLGGSREVGELRAAF